MATAQRRSRKLLENPDSILGEALADPARIASTEIKAEHDFEDEPESSGSESARTNSALSSQANRNASYIKYWTAEEDKALVDAVHKLGCNWTLVENEMRPWGRSKQQCCLRWSYNLDPQINRGPFSIAEDKKLLEAQASMGNKWKQIAEALGTRRHPIALRHRWVYLINGGGPDPQGEDTPSSNRSPLSPADQLHTPTPTTVKRHGSASSSKKRKRQSSHRYDGDSGSLRADMLDQSSQDDISVSSPSTAFESENIHDIFENDAAELLQLLGSKRTKLREDDEPLTPPMLDSPSSPNSSASHSSDTLTTFLRTCMDLQRELTRKIAQYENTMSSMERRIAELETALVDKTQQLENTTRDCERNISALKFHFRALLEDRIAKATVSVHPHAPLAFQHHFQAPQQQQQQQQQQQFVGLNLS